MTNENLVEDMYYYRRDSKVVIELPNGTRMKAVSVKEEITTDEKSLTIIKVKK